MPAYIRRRDLDNRRVIAWRLTSEPLKRINTTEPNIELAAPDLLDRAREALGDLALAIERERPRRVDHADNGDRSSKQREQRSSDSTDLGRALVRVEATGRGHPVGSPRDHRREECNH
jgi:hypothetical protein